MFSGSMVALITPLDVDGEVDMDAIIQLVGKTVDQKNRLHRRNMAICIGTLLLMLSIAVNGYIT